MSKAVVLLSGGLDSATVLAMAAQDYQVYALSFAYGQRHRHELDAAAELARRTGVVAHRVVTIDLAAFGGSALTDATLDVPKDRSHEAMGAGVPITYVPARNTVFLSYALAWAEVLGAFDIFIGVNAIDYSGYPDCRPAFVEAFERVANEGTAFAQQMGRRLKVHAPLIHLTKSQIIKKGLVLGVDYGVTSSCYDPDQNGLACGRCDACQLRRQGFLDAGVADPTRYAPL